MACVKNKAGRTSGTLDLPPLGAFIIQIHLSGKAHRPRMKSRLLQCEQPFFWALRRCGRGSYMLSSESQAQTQQ